MIVRFNLGQLTKYQSESLVNVLEPLGLSDKADLSAVEFPEKLLLRDGENLFNVIWEQNFKAYKVSEIPSEPPPAESVPNPAPINRYDPVKNCVELFYALTNEQQAEFLRQIWWGGRN